MPTRATVVISQGRGKHPTKRDLEASITFHLMQQPNVDVVVTPHLYDLQPDSPAWLELRRSTDSFVMLTWLFPRAAHWILDGMGIRGQMGAPTPTTAARDKRAEPSHPVAESRPAPRRVIYYVDLRTMPNVETLVTEVDARIAACGAPLVTRDHPLRTVSPGETATHPTVPSTDHPTTRRWYPVIDYSRCTNCMECIDFCLFGVYGIDAQEIILVEQPDNCRKGCPACSRVCPENAILFPEHKAPAIAGDPNTTAGASKLNLSELFGAPIADATAAQERDDHLRAAGRPPESRDEQPSQAVTPDDSTEPDAGRRDPLDALVDQLDELDL